MYVIDTINEMYASHLVFSDLPGRIRDILCTYNKLASSQQVFHPLFTENRNATNQSWRISMWCIRHFLPVLLSSEVLRCNSQIVIPIFSSWYGNATTVSDVFCLFVVLCTQSTWRIFSFYNYSRTPLVCFICIKQTITVAVLYFSSTILGVE